MNLYKHKITNRFLTLCSILLVSCFSPSVWAVECTQADITLSTQTQVDNFQATYGGGGICDTVIGTLVITGTIVNLDELSALTTVGEELYIRINHLLTNVDGLSALTTVGQVLSIGNNLALTNVDGLSALTTVGQALLVRRNDSLTNVDGLSALTTMRNLTIDANDSLTNVDGLSALTTVEWFSIHSNPSLTNVDGLSALTTVEQVLGIHSNPSLTNVDGLSALTTVGRALGISRNPSLTNVDGLSALTTVGQVLGISRNPSLTNVDGLSALTMVGNLTIDANDSLTNVDGLSALTTVEWFSIHSNPSLTNVDGLANLISVGQDVSLENNSNLGICSGLVRLLDQVDDGLPGPGPGVAGIPDVGRDVTIDNNLTGCNSVEGILLRFSKAFTPDTVNVDMVSTLTFTIDNTANRVAATELAFTDKLPIPMRIATPANAVNNCTGGTLRAESRTAVITYRGGSVAMETSCTISVDVIVYREGAYANVASSLTSSLGSSQQGGATATLIVVTPIPLFSTLLSGSLLIGLLALIGLGGTRWYQRRNPSY